MVDLFGSFADIAYLCSIKTKDMEEKRYPILEEEENVGLCSEPSLAARYAVEEQFDVPMLGPSTWKEAMDDLDESEKEFDAGKCIPWEDVMSEIKDRYRLYAH